MITKAGQYILWPMDLKLTYKHCALCKQSGFRKNNRSSGGSYDSIGIIIENPTGLELSNVLVYDMDEDQWSVMMILKLKYL